MHSNASRNVDDVSVLVRSTKAKPHAAHGMNERVRSSAVHLPSEAPNIDVDDVRHRIKVEVPDMLQQHGARNDVSGVADQIRQQLKFLRQQLDHTSLAARGTG